MDHSWISPADRNIFTTSATLMGDYAILFSIEALAVLEQGSKRGLVVHNDVIMAEHPVNPLGVESVARALGLLAERIKHE